MLGMETGHETITRMPAISFFGMVFSDPNLGAFQSDFVVAGHVAIAIKDHLASRCPKRSHNDLENKIGSPFYF